MCKNCQFFIASAASFSHVWVLHKEPLAFPSEAILGLLDPLHVIIYVGTIYTKFQSHTITQNSIKTY